MFNFVLLSLFIFSLIFVSLYINYFSFSFFIYLLILFHVGRSMQKKGGLGVLIKSCIPARAKLDFLPMNIEMLLESCVVECFFFQIMRRF